MHFHFNVRQEGVIGRSKPTLQKELDLDATPVIGASQSLGDGFEGRVESGRGHVVDVTVDANTYRKLPAHGWKPPY